MMNDFFEIKQIDIKNLKPNRGQIKDVPKNPRFIKDDRFRKLVKSLIDAPEMLHLREIIVYDNNGEFIVICGNQRLAAAKDAGLATLPCKILSKDTPAAKLREYAIKDNVAFGDDDFELLNEWNIIELKDFGFDGFDFSDGDENFDKENDSESDKFEITLTTENLKDFNKIKSEVSKIAELYNAKVKVK